MSDIKNILKKKKKIIGEYEYEKVNNVSKLQIGGYIKYINKKDINKKNLKYKGYGILLKIDNTNILLTNGYGKLWRVSIQNNIFYYKANISYNDRLRQKLFKLLEK